MYIFEARKLLSPEVYSGEMGMNALADNKSSRFNAKLFSNGVTGDSGEGRWLSDLVPGAAFPSIRKSLEERKQGDKLSKHGCYSGSRINIIVECASSRR